MLGGKFGSRGNAVALHKAIDSRDYEDIKEIIEAGADVNFKLRGTTPLMKVITNNMTRCIPDLIHAGADVNIGNGSGVTPLMYAAQQGDNWSVNLFTRVGLDVNVYMNNVWQTSIFYFGRNDDPLIVRRRDLYVTHEEDYMRYVKDLVKSGADVNKIDKSGQTALFYALSNKRHGCVHTLIKSGADVNKVDRNGKTASIMAAEYCDNKALMLLLEEGADVNQVDKEGKTALSMAAKHCNNKALMLLLGAGADVNLGSALHIAVSEKRILAMGRMMTVEPSQNLNLLTSRHAAAILRIKQQFIETLTAAGADVNAINQAGFTPLMCAAKQSDLNLVTYLLRAKASINKRDKIGRNALMLNCPSWHQSPSGQQQHVALLLFAAGETIDGTIITSHTPASMRPYIPDAVSEKDSDVRLLPLCRETTRKHLLRLDPHTHLFIRVPKLGLPVILRNYVLYDVALEPQQTKYKID